MGHILVVDDEPTVLSAFRELLSESGHSVITAANGFEALAHVREHEPDVVVTDLCMPGMNGLDTFREIRTISGQLPVIIMTGQGTMETAIEATKAGAFDYQLKPFEPETMLATIDRAVQSATLMRRDVVLDPGADEAASADALVGGELQEVFKAIGRVAATDATVLVRGESGTGKELVVRAIYQHSLRAAVPLVIVNCVAIPDALLESELFGHERGAFTGADARRLGKFEQAHGGTIFLDEIGDIALPVQAKILRVLQQRTLQRVGGSDTLHVDVRVLAATNRNLEKAIAEGTFREDLYHRLNVVTISIPPLRERRADIPKLVDYFLRRYARELKINKPVVTDEALQMLCAYGWIGNVRELEHCVYRTLIFTQGFPIQADDVQRAFEAAAEPTGASEPCDDELLRDLIRRYLDGRRGAETFDAFVQRVERLLLDEAMRRTAGNQTQAAQLLGLTRPTLHAKIQKHALPRHPPRLPR